MVQPYQVMEKPGFSNGNGSGEPVLNLTSNVQRGKGHLNNYLDETKVGAWRSDFNSIDCIL